VRITHGLSRSGSRCSLTPQFYVEGAAGIVGFLVANPIDVMHMDRDRVICAYEINGLIVDPGPASCVETLLDRLGPVEPRVLLLTHIHLDHAGATGVLCRRFPELQVHVHERGAAHLVDPSKLLTSASRLYGDQMDLLWGEVAPVPAERVHALRGGETVEGFRVAYTPGHASHHVCYLHEDSGDAYVGDMAGVRIPPFAHTLAPTPPPDIDVEQWLDSLHTLASWGPQSLCLTHFGKVTDVADQLHRIRTALANQADSARIDGEEGFIARLENEVGAVADAESVQAYEQAAPPDQLYKGLERYWRKRAEAA
jgi:glyoxylase-like metal-dependent hydrolase (beta-lactamase superfamily II)